MILLIALAAIVLALAFIVVTLAQASPQTDPPECPPGQVCDELPPPPDAPRPGAVFMPFVVEVSAK
jgi:hypothetical protein